MAYNRKRAKRRGATRSAPRRPLIVRPTVGVGQVVKYLALCLVVCGVALLAFHAGDLMDHPVRKVSVQGEFKYLQPEAIKQAVAPHIQNDYLTVPLGELRASLEALAWVDSAAVSRDWPDGLVLEIEEQTPIAWWGEDMLINNRGVLFAPADAAIEEALPRLDGPEGSQGEVMARYIDLNRILGSRDMAVQTLQMSVRGSWSTALQSGVELVFGSGRVVQKLQRFLAMYDHTLVRYMPDIGRIDLRYKNGVAVTWLRRPGTGEQK